MNYSNAFAEGQGHGSESEEGGEDEQMEAITTLIAAGMKPEEAVALVAKLMSGGTQGMSPMNSHQMPPMPSRYAGGE